MRSRGASMSWVMRVEAMRGTLVADARGWAQGPAGWARVLSDKFAFRTPSLALGARKCALSATRA